MSTLLRSSRSRKYTIAPLAGLVVLSLSGCGGNAGTGNAVRVRGVDAITNSVTADIEVNNGSAFGDMAYFQVTNYQYMKQGNLQMTSLTNFTNPPVLSPGIYNVPVYSGQYYTIFMYGRTDVATTSPEYINVAATQDTPKPQAPSGDALIRLVIAAPDINTTATGTGAVDVTVNGSIPAGFSDQAYIVPGNAFLDAPFAVVPAGNSAIQVNVTGTTTPVVPAQTVTLAAGQAYTVVVVEPKGGGTGAAPTAAGSTFGLQLITD